MFVEILKATAFPYNIIALNIQLAKASLPLVVIHDGRVS